MSVSSNDPPPRRAFIGDVHGCFDELIALLAQIGFSPASPDAADRIDEAWFVGDLVNGGPRSDKVLALVGRLIEQRRGGFVLGNHDDNLLRALDGDPEPSARTHATLDQIDASDMIDRTRVHTLLADALLQRRFADSDLLLVHAAPIDPASGSAERRRTALYGPVADGKDEQGRVLRINWPRTYDGADFVVFGHSPHRAPARFGRAICLDTGCVYGGTLTAYLPHEDRCLAVPAQHTYTTGNLRETTSAGPYL